MSFSVSEMSFTISEMSFPILAEMSFGQNAQKKPVHVASLESYEVGACSEALTYRGRSHGTLGFQELSGPKYTRSDI